jgi:hypothetical protein
MLILLYEGLLMVLVEAGLLLMKDIEGYNVSAVEQRELVVKVVVKVVFARALDEQVFVKPKTQKATKYCGLSWKKRKRRKKKK